MNPTIEDYLDTIELYTKNPFRNIHSRKKKLGNEIIFNQKDISLQKLIKDIDCQIENIPYFLETKFGHSPMKTKLGLVIAFGHFQKYNNEPKDNLLPHDQIPLSFKKLFKVSQFELVELCNSVGACHAELDKIIGDSKAMQDVKAYTWQACFGNDLVNTLGLSNIIRNCNVFIAGDTGTGKELVAKAIQAGNINTGNDAINRKKINSISLNVAAIPKDLIESELFGYEKGAFTGANKKKIGILEKANYGTLFLDEIGDLPYSTQTKLLRVIETGEFFSLGSTSPTIIDIRYISATHKDMQDLISKNKFRLDLFKRLSTASIYIPSLIERTNDQRTQKFKNSDYLLLDDIERIAEDYINKEIMNPKQKKEIKTEFNTWYNSIDLKEDPFPGNVRDIKSIITKMILGMDYNKPNFVGDFGVVNQGQSISIPEEIATCQASLEMVKSWYIKKVVNFCGKKHHRAAERLGVSPSTVYRYIRRFTS